MTPTPWIMLCLALGALAFPFPGLYSRRHSYRALVELDIERRNESWWRAWRRVARFPWHWAEFARGVTGSWLAKSQLDEVAAGWPPFAELSPWAGSVIPLIAALVSVVLSALLFRSPGKQPAPVFFVGAAVLTLVSPAVALPGVLLAAAVTLALKSMTAYFLTLGFAVLALGMVLDRVPWPALAASILAITPVLIAAGSQRELLLPVHRSRARHTGSESEHKL